MLMCTYTFRAARAECPKVGSTKEENSCRNIDRGCGNREPPCHIVKPPKGFKSHNGECIVLARITFKARIEAVDEASATPLFFELLILSTLFNS